MYYELENDKIKIVVSDLGATLVKFIDKNTNTDIVLGFDDEEGYIKNQAAHIGGSVGRNANRIGNARFNLNGQEYILTANNFQNNLHSGNNNFYKKRWNLVSKTDDEIILSLFSKDGDEGFPGNLNVEVKYKLDDNNLYWFYTGVSDKDTIFNMTNHSYFNMGKENCFDLLLKVHTDKYAPNDENSLALEEVSDVKNTPYDFRDFKRVYDNISKIENGIDNNYVWEYMGDKLMAELKSEKLHLSVYSDLPDMHLYTAGSLDECLGKNNQKYQKYGAVCLECQFFPNAINYQKHIKPILKKDEKATHFIRFQLNNS